MFPYRLNKRFWEVYDGVVRARPFYVLPYAQQGKSQVKQQQQLSLPVDTQQHVEPSLIAAPEPSTSQLEENAKELERREQIRSETKN